MSTMNHTLLLFGWSTSRSLAGGVFGIASSPSLQGEESEIESAKRSPARPSNEGLLSILETSPQGGQ